MTALARPAPARPAPARPVLAPLRIARKGVARLDGPALRRMLLAGVAWGVTVSLGLTAARAWRCGDVCLDTAAVDALITAAIGAVTVGPLTLFRRPADDAARRDEP
ncbi:hypothetical protein [Rhodoplanes azumiensis]|uniref:Uncharacterized protein n=1 Tax=Rhodoplanes azumiensis TaxID=1897628 RepID=A0ABW5AMK2_9BRAD